MFKRVSLLICACAFMFLAGCAGSKGGSSSYYDDSDGGSEEGGGGGSSGKKRGSSEPRAPRADELKEAKAEALSLTEENHKLAKEVFDLKAKMGIIDD